MAGRVAKQRRRGGWKMNTLISGAIEEAVVMEWARGSYGSRCSLNWEPEWTRYFRHTQESGSVTKKKVA